MGSFPHQVFLSRNTEKHKEIQHYDKTLTYQPVITHIDRYDTMNPYSRFEVSLMRTLLETETITFECHTYNKTTIKYPEIQTMRLPT